MRIIRASEISSYLYCQRAWWYQRQGNAPQNQSELVDGQELHQRHGRAVFVSGLLRLLAYLMILSAFILIGVYIAQSIV
jgi:hypothetical protein